MKSRTRRSFVLISTLALAACDDSTDGTGGAGGASSSTGSQSSTASSQSSTTSSQASTSSASASSSSASSGTGGGMPFVLPAPVAIALAADGPDQLQSVAVASDGAFVAAGFAAQTAMGPKVVTVVKYTAAGPSAGFGANGVAATPLVFVGGSDEIDVAVQSDGKILVSATVASAIVGDRDIAITRLNTDGTTDMTFGTAGVRTYSVNDAILNAMGMLTAFDASRSLAVDTANNIYLHAAARAVGATRIDTDFVVLKFAPNGLGEPQKYVLDIAMASATPRSLEVLADGSILASGYANTPDVGDTVQPVVYKLTPQLVPDTSFATGGLFHEPVLAVQTEVYGFAIHGSMIVTAGYGRSAGMTNDYVSLRLGLGDGVLDATWGTNGAVVVDPSGAMLGSNARGAVGLPGGKTLIHGSAGPGNMQSQDATLVFLDANGGVDTDYGTGIHLVKLGADGNDQFWGAAVSGNSVSVVGFQGGNAAPMTTNDDSFVLVFEAQ